MRAAIASSMAFVAWRKASASSLPKVATSGNAQSSSASRFTSVKGDKLKPKAREDIDEKLETRFDVDCRCRCRD
jgi:hypothetical protein